MFTTCDDFKKWMVAKIESYGTPKFALYTNAVTITGGETVTSFTEVSDASYARQALGSGTVGLVGSHVAQDVFATVTFPAMTADQVVYGYYLLDVPGNSLIGAEAFASGPITIPAGDPFPLSFVYKFGGCS